MRAEDGQEQIVIGEHGVRPQRGGDFLGPALLDLSARRSQGVIVRQRQLDRLVEIDPQGRRLILPAGYARP